jgi:AraC-like DNA-binding protein
VTQNRVIALLRGPEDQARLKGAVRGTAELMPCRGPDDVLALLGRGSAVAVIVTAYPTALDDSVALTRAVRTRFPSVPVIVYFDPRWMDGRDLMDLFSAGAVEVVQSRADDLRRVFVNVLASAGHRVKARNLLDQLAPLVPPKALPIIEYLLENGDAPLTIDEAASAVGIARRTLQKRLAALGYPPPETLIGWCRLLIAAQLLEDNTRSFDDVALQLDFPSGMALRSMLKRYTGVTGRAARDGDGPSALVLRHLTTRLTTPQAALAMHKRSAKDALRRMTVPRELKRSGRRGAG